MKKKTHTLLLSLLLLLTLVYFLSIPIGNIPPIGKITDPFIGFIQTDNDHDLNDGILQIGNSGLKDTVRVFFDDRKIPHIYANNEEDLFFAQGYVTARMRLWQMDFLSYVAAGRLSELFKGEGYLEYDREQRRIGVPEAAEKSLALIEKDPVAIRVLDAYTRGVNTYIKELGYRYLPVEYKLLGYSPEPWSNLKSVLVFKQIGNTLAGYDEDMMMSKLILALGEDDFAKLYPDFVSPITPVMNIVSPDVKRGNRSIRKPAYLNDAFLSSISLVSRSTNNPHLGSNSWAVSGKLTKSGHPILCNDPHLGLSLPNIWMEYQLVCPGINVYGVSIPGLPTICIGFNENIAWGITNGADDVKDWYKLKINPGYRRYQVDGIWIPFDLRIEEIKRKGQRSFFDTIYHSIYGPVVYNRDFTGQHKDLTDLALKWELHDPSNEFSTFIRLSSARNYSEYRKIISDFHCPVLNFTFACRDDTISVDHQGKMPLKSPGQGRFVMDGTRKDLIWTGYISEDSLPHLVNPSCQFVLSANQHPTWAEYPFYYNGYYSENRANEIQLRLQQGPFDIQSMQSIQMDNVNSFAIAALPKLVARVDTTRLNGLEKNSLTMLSRWKGDYGLLDENAELFNLWWENITNNTWDEISDLSFYCRKPDDHVLLDLIHKDPINHYFKRKKGTGKENASDIVTKSFMEACDSCDKLKAEGKRTWGDMNKVNLMHYTQIPAFSVMNLSSGGYPEAINAISQDWGPSWRMIVELGERPKAYGIYPGGQSGNPGSNYYDNFVGDWNKGKYYPLLFFISINEANSQSHTQWMLK